MVHDLKMAASRAARVFTVGLLVAVLALLILSRDDRVMRHFGGKLEGVVHHQAADSD